MHMPFINYKYYLPVVVVGKYLLISLLYSFNVFDSFAAAFFVSFPALWACPNKLVCCNVAIDIPANINNIMIVILMLLK